MNLGPITDPELLGLLREISADPKSRLMRLAIQGVDKRIGLHERPISAGEPFLTRAERHLVREHREQVARLFYEAGKKAFLEAPLAETLSYRGPQAGWGPVPDRETLDNELAEVLRQSPGDPLALELLELVDPTVPGRRTDYLEAFLVAALRLDARDSLRNLLGLARVSQGRRNEGFAIWSDVLQHRPCAWYRFAVAQNVAFERAEEGDLQSARQLYREASLAENERPEPLVGLIHTSLRFGDAHEVVRNAERLSELDCELVDACVSEHVDIWRQRALSRGFIPTEKSADCSRRLLDRLPAAAASVAQLFIKYEGERP